MMYISPVLYALFPIGQLDIIAELIQHIF